MSQAQLEFQRSFYDRHYPRRMAATLDQLAHPLFRSFYDRLAQRVLDQADTPAGTSVRVFEAGCGEGFLAAALARVAATRGVSVEYIGADLSNGALDLARQSGVTTDLMLGDATETTAQLPAGSQDVVIAKNLLHHLDDPTAFLTEAARAVGPGGKVVVIEPLLGCPHIWVFNVLAFRRERHYFRGQKRNLSAFREAGLAVENGQRFSWLPWELMLYIRPSVFRRLLSTTNERTIGRIGRFDDWLTSRIPWTAAYVVWTVTPEGVHDGEPRPAPSTPAR